MLINKNFVHAYLSTGREKKDKKIVLGHIQLLEGFFFVE